MSTMTLARLHAANDIRLDQVAIPTPGPNDILVKVMHCGICGSDLSYTKLGSLPGGVSPMPLGHEFAGVVDAKGCNVAAVSIGDRVAINPEGAGNAIGCGGAQGAFAAYVLVENVVADPGLVIKLPASIDFELSALIEPLAVGMNGIDRANIQTGETVVVFGAGPVGLSAALLAKHCYDVDVVVADLSEKRLAVAKALGLTPFLAGAGSIDAFLKDRHGRCMSEPRLGEQASTDVYIEATGVGEVFQTIMKTAKKNARVVVIGVHFSPIKLDMVNFLIRQLTLSASMSYTNDTFTRVCKILEADSLDVRPLITHHYPLSQFDTAFNQAKRQDEAVKVLINCQQ